MSLANASDPWASYAAADPRTDDAPPRRRATRSTRQSRLGQPSVKAVRESKKRTTDDDDDGEDGETVETASEGESDEVDVQNKSKQRSTRKIQISFKDEAENASLSALANTRTPRSKKIVVKEEVEKINAKEPLAQRTNKTSTRDSQEDTGAVNRHVLHSSNESFATASIDPWGVPLVQTVQTKTSNKSQVAKSTPSSAAHDNDIKVKAKRAFVDTPVSPNRYEPVRSTPKRSKEATTAAAFGSPTAVLTATNAPLRANTAEGQSYVCPGPPLPPKGECYLGLWRGEERARILAYEACVQTCLEGSLGSYTAQNKFDMGVFFLTNRCAELRKAFGLDSVLVGVLPDESRSPDSRAITPDKSGRRSDSMRIVGAGAGGVRWAAITVGVSEVCIVERGIKKYTQGWDPRDHGWQKPTEARGQHLIIRTEGGPGSAEVCEEMRTKQEPVRLALGPGDTTFIIEVPLKANKTAKAVIALDELCRLSDKGVVELDLMLTADVPATAEREAHVRTYEKGTVKLTAVFEAAVGAGLMSAPPGAGTAPGRDTQGWAEANAALTPQAAYDFSLGAALRAIGFTRRRLRVHGNWELLLKELAEGHNVTTTYTSLRYIQHMLAVATPTADCLSMIRDHLREALRRQVDGSLGSVESQMLNSIRVAVMTLVCVCFQHYKSLDESEFRGITESMPPIVPAPALSVSLELFKALQRDPSSSASLEIMTKEIISAARACFKKNRAVLIGDARTLAVNNKDLVTQLYVCIGNLCVTLRHELDTDRTIMETCSFPSGFSLPLLSADVYCSEVAATLQDALDTCPPSGPPSSDILDCIDRSCDLQASASLEEDQTRASTLKLNTRHIFQPHIDGWIESSRKRLEARCSAALNSKGVSGNAIDDAYAAMDQSLEGFERIVTRWPDQAMALEEILVGAERLIIHKIAETVEHLHVGIQKDDEAGTIVKPPLSRKGAAQWMNIGRMKEGAASIAKRTAQVSNAVSKRFAMHDRAHGGMPPELAAALNALKSMEILRPDVGARLMEWANNGGGAGPELGRRMSEALGELRAHYSGYLRRAVAGVYSCGPSLRSKLRDADAKQDVEPVVAPVVTYIESIKSTLERKLPQRRAKVGVLRGLWDSIGAEALAFYEEDLRTNSTWHRRVLASAAIDIVSENFSQVIRESLGHDVQDKDLEAPTSIAKLQAFNSSTARDSVQLY